MTSTIAASPKSKGQLSQQAAAPGGDVADPRRHLPIERRKDYRGIVQLFVDDVLWAEVEYSHKRDAWCIQDAEGRCLSHKAHIHGDADSLESAIAITEATIRDGRMPTPEEAKAVRNARLEKRRNSPSAKRRREEREEQSRLSRARWHAEEAEDEAEPLYELIAEAFDLTDPELWRSNRFAMLRPRLVLSVRRAIAELEWEDSFLSKDEARDRRLARAREILAMLEPAP